MKAKEKELNEMMMQINKSKAYEMELKNKADEEKRMTDELAEFKKR